MKTLLSVLLFLFCLSIHSQTSAVTGTGDLTPEMASQIIANMTAKIEASPENGVLYHQRGMIYLVQKDQQKAIADFTKSITLKSNVQAASFFMRAITKQTTNDPTACDDFSSAKLLGHKFDGWKSIDEMCGFED